MRVALVACSLDILGGQGVQAKALLEALQRDGISVRFVPINPSFPRWLRLLRRVGGVRTLLNEALYLPSLSALRGCDVVHVLSASYWSFLLAAAPALLASRLFGKRTILNYHSGEADDHLSRWGLLVHPWLRMAHEIVVPSEYLRSVFAAHGYQAHVVRNVVDLSEFAFREPRFDGPKLLSTRNLEAHYRVENTIDAFELLRRRHPGATLTIAGCGSREPELRSRAGALNGQVRFLGRVEPEDMPGLYAEHDLFLNSSVVDNQPLSILEALATGLPVVSTATGDIAAMLRGGEAGLLVAPEDPKAMAAAVSALLQEPSRAMALARRGREAVGDYSWPRVRGQWQDVYEGGA